MRNLGLMLGLNALVTAAGIYAYDVMRKPADGGGSGVLSSSDSGRLESRIEALENRERSPLQGAQSPDLAGRISILEKRLDSGAAPVGDASSGSRPRTEMPALPTVAESTSGGTETVYDERELTRFRSAMEEVERRRRQENLVQGIKSQLAMLDLKLTPDQERLVIQETMRHRERVSEIWRSGARDERGRNENMTAMQKAREEWTKVINEGLPAADAEKVIASMGRGMAMGAPGRLDTSVPLAPVPPGGAVSNPPR